MVQLLLSCMWQGSAAKHLSQKSDSAGYRLDVLLRHRRLSNPGRLLEPVRQQQVEHPARNSLMMEPQMVLLS